MKLKNLTITRGWSGNDPLTGKIEFSTDEGEIKLHLSDEDCQPILEHCADAIVKASKRVAATLTASAMQATAIEHQSDDESQGATK